MVFYFRQANWLFPVNRLAKVDDEPLLRFKASVDKGLTSIQQHWLNHDFGKTELWFLPSLKASDVAPTVIIAHGQLGVIDSWAERLTALREHGFHCLLVEFPGYGRSEGAPSAKTLKQTFCAAYDWVAAKPEVEASQIIGLGRSMGGGIIMMLADHRPLCQLWLFSTFTSLRPFVARRGVPKFLLHDPFDNEKRLATKNTPCLILHGTADDVIPVSHGKALAKAAKQGQLVLQTGDHNSCPDNWRDFSAFIADYYASHR